MAYLWRATQYRSPGRMKKVKRNLKISVTKQPRTDGLVACRKVTVREKLLTRLLGPPNRVMVLVPGDSVDAVSITETPEGGEAS
jgi:hypothetical protein